MRQVLIPTAVHKKALKNSKRHVKDDRAADVKKKYDTLLEENFNLMLELDRFNRSLIDKSQRKDIDNQIVEDLTVSPI